MRLEETGGLGSLNFEMSFPLSDTSGVALHPAACVQPQG